jgi:hypothetical protein
MIVPYHAFDNRSRSLGQSLSGGTDLTKLIGTARQLAAADALMAIEGNNEPNNWGVTYQGEKGGITIAPSQRNLVSNGPGIKT